jgi:hypothetical protein
MAAPKVSTLPLVSSAPNYKALAEQFNQQYPGLGWDEGIVEQFAQTYDETLNETLGDHLECYADHQVLVASLATEENV